MDAKHHLGDQEQDTRRVNREASEASHAGADTIYASARRDFDDEEGQLGPDELSDPAEVVMNHEAKLHR
jgi:hypothetical protein